MSREFFKFLLAGGLAAGANYGSRFAFSIVFSYAVSIVLAYLVGMTVAFILMRVFVFASSGKAFHLQIPHFILINLLAIAQTLVVSLVLAQSVLPAIGIVHHIEAIAHAIGVLVPVLTSYVGHKRLTFR